MNWNSIPLAFTESNITWNGKTTENTFPASPHKYYASLWIADQIGVSLEKNIFTICFWSLAEGNSLSFLDPISKKPRPNYFVQQLFSTHIKDLCFVQDVSDKDYSIYCGYDRATQKIVLIILNKTKTPINLNIDFSTMPFAIPRFQLLADSYSIYCIEVSENNPNRILKYSENNAVLGFVPQ